MKDLMKTLFDYGVSKDEINERFCGDNDLYLQCFQMYLSEENWTKLDAAIQAKNWEDAFIAAHTLKGISGNLGLKKIASSISVVVESLRSKKNENIRREYSAVCTDFAELKKICQ